MKRTISLLLSMISILFLLAGCSAKEEASNIGPGNTPTQATEPSVQIAADVISQALDVEIDAQTLEVDTLHEIDGQTIAHCTQNYLGLEILDSSIVAIGGEEPQVIGTYYDLSEAFGEDFDAAVQQASQVPDWMKDQVIDGMTVTYHTDTLKPVIHLDEDKPVIAIQFDVSLGDLRYTMVMDPSGETCYQYTTSMLGFTSTQTQDGTWVAEQDGKYYAYDMQHNIYISNICVMDEDILDKYYDGTGALVEDYLIRELTGGSSDQFTLRLLDATADVMQWYEDQFDYRGVDGTGGEAMCIIIDKSKLGSIAANTCEKGHVFLLAYNFIMESIADAPEIFAHEMGHAVLKNVVGLKNSNQSGSLHEAISDVFACLYDPDGDWEIGDGLHGVSSRNIAKYDRTMQDFRYDYQYLPNVLDGTVEYIGDNNLLTYLRSKVVGTQSCSYGKYYNAAIVSGVLHKIWQDVFNKDDALMGQILMDSLQYLPRSADFYQFRAAFMYACRKVTDSKTTQKVGMFFDKVRIYHDSDHYKAVQEMDTPDTLLEILDRTYGEICAMNWDSRDHGNVYDYWFCYFGKGDYSLHLTYIGTEEPDVNALPESLDLFYINEKVPVGSVQITKGLTFGMTYGEIAEKFAISPLENTEYAGSEYPVVAWIETDEHRFCLIFTGVDENAVFNGVSIMRS